MDIYLVYGSVMVERMDVLLDMIEEKSKIFRWKVGAKK